MQQVPVYIFTGFLESGKTTFIIDTLRDPAFTEGEKTLVIVCEEGEVEYEEDMLEETNSVIEYVDEPESLTHDYFVDLQKKHRPAQVIIEYNGTWPMAALLDLEPPRQWIVAEIMSTADGSNFDTYIANMRSMLLDQFSQSDVLIFNRCSDMTPKATYKRYVKANNRKLRVIFENLDGSIDSKIEEELPYNLNDDLIVVKDDDFGIFYIDAMENPDKYEGKKVRFKGMVYKNKKMGSTMFVPGRHVMTCCEDDIAFFGFLCKCKDATAYKIKSWVNVEAEIKIEYLKEYNGDGPVLYARKIESCDAPKETLLYF
ncbi:MAG: GTPase [Lachnospiraceae bacterium]|nr:GTPase [Lachnospiraceae bacterium]